MVGMGVRVTRIGSIVAVGGSVLVAVTGSGEAKTSGAMVGVPCAANSTSEIDNAPSISPTESIVTTSAFPNSRNPCITSYLFCPVFPEQPRQQQSAITH